MDLVEAAPTPSILVQPSQAGSEWVVLLEPSSMLELEDLAAPELKLAGVRFDPEGGVPSRRIGYASISLLHRESKTTLQVTNMPKGRIYSVRWSPLGDRVVFTALDPDTGSMHLYSFAPSAGAPAAVKVTPLALSGVFASSFAFVGGGDKVTLHPKP